MKYRLFSVVLCLVSLCVWNPSARGADVKIGYFDLQAVLDRSQWGQEVKKEFNTKKAQLEADVQAKAKEFQEVKESFEKQLKMMDEKSKKQKAQELRQMQMEGEKLLMESNAELNRLSQQLTKPLIDKIMDIVQTIGKKGKYDFIFEAQKAGLAYANEKSDLTQTIIKELDKVKR
ncbi:OmpH family outer membrane protein [Desulfosoma caldarium]|uniref:Periplasmic chaperone for outer membrane proteins Skp n=1 Tax=Desulfosoma caldarium TaxID=610254 RepID=A0A3N1ULZ9_9BACT|nr:OmpH family outer membrane protein [Desulfosoma caldarium]ROQ92232.1 periplasmic chaperone for outer membrane proteins Skp [Desulfosoma caldarium]